MEGSRGAVRTEAGPVGPEFEADTGQCKEAGNYVSSLR